MFKTQSFEPLIFVCKDKIFAGFKNKKTPSIIEGVFFYMICKNLLILIFYDVLILFLSTSIRDQFVLQQMYFLVHDELNKALLL